jgi:hypothetical protein
MTQVKLGLNSDQDQDCCGLRASFSEFIFSDFRHNKFLKFLMENKMAKFCEFIVKKI